MVELFAWGVHRGIREKGMDRFGLLCATCVVSRAVVGAHRFIMGVISDLIGVSIVHHSCVLCMY